MSADALDGTHNFRDLGGLPAGGATTRAGVLMRSDALIRLGGSGRAALAERGVRTVLDLREPVERALDPVDLAGSGVEYVEWPLLDGLVDLHTPKGLGPLYHDIIERCGERFAGAVGTLARPGALPALVFCSAGKDRTGLLVALWLSAAGVDDDAVVADYARTGEAMRGAFRAAVEARARAAGLSEQALAVKLGAPADLMREILATLSARHGGAARYLTDHGLPEDRLAALRAAFVEPSLGSTVVSAAPRAPWSGR
jgi:protein-tyrosine phosphatase